MSLYYRTLLEAVNPCLQYDVTNGSGATDFIFITYLDCNGTLSSLSLTVPGVSQLICSSSIPVIINIFGSGSVNPTGLTC